MNIVQEVRKCNTTGQVLPITEFYTYKRKNSKGETYYYTEKVCKDCRKKQFKKNNIYRKAIKEYNKIQGSKGTYTNSNSEVVNWHSFPVKPRHNSMIDFNGILPRRDEKTKLKFVESLKPIEKPSFLQKVKDFISNLIT